MEVPCDDTVVVSSRQSFDSEFYRKNKGYRFTTQQKACYIGCSLLYIRYGNLRTTVAWKKVKTYLDRTV